MFELGQEELSATKVVDLSQSENPKVNIPQESIDRLNRFRKLVEDKLGLEERFYGINTGFGYLSNISIEEDKLAELQINLIRSHACGVGEFTEAKVVRSLMVLRLHTFLKGHSGISKRAVDTLSAMLKHDILPVIPKQGSVGASGDLAPLAHLALGILGEGKCHYKGELVKTKVALEKEGITPFKPEAKEGLSLINGTHYMTAIAAHAVKDAHILMKTADVITALSLDALKGTKRAFDPRIHQIRPHAGQATVASNILGLLEGKDDIMESHVGCEKVQDPYSFRCTPQVHGASRDTIEFITGTVNRELNSVTDNPLVFDDGDVISGGNFHGQYVAMAMDQLAIALSEIGSISERRTEKLTNPNLSGLPAFLMKDSGLNSGYMIPHVVSASLTSENKVLCHPASVDSIPTSADKEDHVSMGPIAAHKARKVARNVSYILAIELLAACQGIDLLSPLKPSAPLTAVFDKIRSISPYMDTDRSLYEDIEAVSNLVLSGEILDIAIKAGANVK
jgi:histidine ammonia-lyase